MEKFGSSVGFNQFLGHSPGSDLGNIRFRRDPMSVYVGNLSFDVTKEDLSEVFGDYGTVKEVKLPTDRETGRPRGFGFVEMSTEEEEAAAIEALDGAEWMGRDMRVNKAKPRENKGGSYGGGGGGRRRDRY